jgi:hypothetical protein
VIDGEKEAEKNEKRDFILGFRPIEVGGGMISSRWISGNGTSY